jgi:nucleotide-binding universal stress UspA family protein
METRSWMQGSPKAILLATDLSARCDRALDRAALLAAEWQARLVIVHALEEDAIGTLGGSEHVPSWRRQADPQQMAEIRTRSELREICPGATVVIERGSVADVILRAAETHGCGLILTGVARNEPLGRLVLGSTVNRLVRHSQIPVLVVRKRGRRPYRSVVVAADFSDSSRHALEATGRFFPRLPLTVFNAHDAPMSGLVTDVASYREQMKQAATREAEDFLRSCDLSGWTGQKPDLLIEYGEPDRLLHDYATEKDIDLVAFGTHGRSMLFDALIGSVAQSLVSTVPCDALVVREPRAKAAG